MSNNNEPEKPKEEQIFPVKKEEPIVEQLKQQVNFLTQQNMTLRNVLQGIVITLDKISRSQSTNIGTVTNSLENILNALPKENQQQ